MTGTKADRSRLLKQSTATPILLRVKIVAQPRRQLPVRMLGGWSILERHTESSMSSSTMEMPVVSVKQLLYTNTHNVEFEQLKPAPDNGKTN